MKLSKLIELIDCDILQGSIDIDIKNIVYDSRKAAPGCVFVALPGYVTDGHNYINSAAGLGAAAVIVSKDILHESDITIIKTYDTRVALAKISSTFFGDPAKSLKTIAVTGTKGKTTTAAMIKYILEEGGITTGTIGTLGIIIGENLYKTNNTTPESYEIQQALHEMVSFGCQAAVIEVSSQGLKYHRTHGIDFDFGIFTNLSSDHIGKGEHENFDEYVFCKSLLFKQCRTGIINIDDKLWQAVTSESICNIETFSYNGSADLTACESSLIVEPGHIGVRFNTYGIRELSADIIIPGRFNIYNALAAILLSTHFNVSTKNITDGLRKAKVKGRVEPVKVPGGYTLLIDYAHNAYALEHVLTTLREYQPNRIITMFGAGGNRPKSRRYEMGEVSGKLSDLSVITEDNSRFESPESIIQDILEGINKTSGKYEVIPNRKNAIRYCMQIAKENDIVLLAGKGHEDYQETNGVKYHFDEREVIAEILSKS